jgi:hypothetical protein
MKMRGIAEVLFTFPRRIIIVAAAGDGKAEDIACVTTSSFRVVHALRLIASQPTRQPPPLPLAQLFPRTAPRIDTDLVDHNMKPSPRRKATAPSLPKVASGGFQREK